MALRHALVASPQCQVQLAAALAEIEAMKNPPPPDVEALETEPKVGAPKQDPEKPAKPATPARDGAKDARALAARAAAAAQKK